MPLRDREWSRQNNLAPFSQQLESLPVFWIARQKILFQERRSGIRLNARPQGSDVLQFFQKGSRLLQQRRMFWRIKLSIITGVSHCQRAAPDRGLFTSQSIASVGYQLKMLELTKGNALPAKQRVENCVSQF